MTDPVLLRQVYWPDDDSEKRAGKISRLIAATSAQNFPVEITIRRHRKKHSNDARAYLWGVCYALLSEASGYEKEELHEAMCKSYFGVKPVQVMGQTFDRPLRTTTHNEHGERDELDVSSYGQFIEFVIREAALWYDIAIPPPKPKDMPT